MAKYVSTSYCSLGDWNTGSFMAIRSMCRWQYWMGQCSTTTSLILPQVVFTSLWPLILKEGRRLAKVTVFHVSENAPNTNAPTLRYLEAYWRNCYWYAKQIILSQVFQFFYKLPSLGLTATLWHHQGQRIRISW